VAALPSLAGSPGVRHLVLAGRHFAASSPSTPKISIILLDQASLDWGSAENGWPWPWPRSVYGALLDFVQRGNPRAVAFDVLYTEPSAYDVADDEDFAAAMARSQPFVGAVFLGRQAIAGDEPGRSICADPHRGWVDVDAWLNPNTRRTLVEPGAAFPVPVLASNATLLANVNDAPDRDGVFRRATLFRVFDGQAVPSLGLAAFRAAYPDTAHCHRRRSPALGPARPAGG
jgi:adenylate cyclase